MIGMKSLQDVVRTKELEILRAVEDALLQKDAELRQLQKGLLEALRVVNRLLEADNTAVEAALAQADAAGKKFTAPAVTPVPASVSVPPPRYETPLRAAVMDAAPKQFP